MTDKLEELAKILDKSSDYRVLRRLPETTRFNDPKARVLHTAVVLDSETTGQASTDEIIELSMLKFTYDDDGVI